MALTGIGGVDPGLEDFLEAFAADFLRGDTKDIGIMMLAAQARHLDIVREHSADTGDLVGRDAQAKAMFFDKDSKLFKAGFNITTRNW